ncbi:3-oxoacid CoA-transferase subunit B [Amycolatopsis pigmentata]|uniref:3-oxoacid CoA-transferase subunit B n=1 Tax=Amycolatopsis pigmentata TaxID=450801 RepID=A0ABW5FKY0_9PSEU
MAWNRTQIAEVAAREIRPGDYVNLGIGIPTLVVDHVPPGHRASFHSENGLLGMGPFPLVGDEDPDVINAGKQTVTIAPGGSVFDSATSFALVRGGRIAISFLGAMQVSAEGDLANWAVPGAAVKGMGGAMDLVAGARRVIALTEHTTRDGSPKIVDRCTLPLTGRKVVDRIITSLGVFDVEPDGLVLVELAPGTQLDDLRRKTAADFQVRLTAAKG